MKLFNFHHHQLSDFGIYNLKKNEAPSEFSFSAGIHPKDILKSEEKKQFSWLMNVAAHENCVAIGECGLDNLISVPMDFQKKMFQKQIYLANELQKPLIIHCVQKFHELPNFIKTAEVAMVVHGFNKRESIGNELLNKGFYLSFGKSLLQNVNLQLFLENMPLDRLFLETDTSEIEIEKIYRKAAEIKKISVEKLDHQIQENLQKIGILI